MRLCRAACPACCHASVRCCVSCRRCSERRCGVQAMSGSSPRPAASRSSTASRTCSSWRRGSTSQVGCHVLCPLSLRDAGHAWAGQRTLSAARRTCGPDCRCAAALWVDARRPQNRHATRPIAAPHTHPAEGRLCCAAEKLEVAYRCAHLGTLVPRVLTHPSLQGWLAAGMHPAAAGRLHPACVPAPAAPQGSAAGQPAPHCTAGLAPVRLSACALCPRVLPWPQPSACCAERAPALLQRGRVGGADLGVRQQLREHAGGHRGAPGARAVGLGQGQRPRLRPEGAHQAA